MDDKDYALSLMRNHAYAFAGMTRSELAKGTIQVDRERGVMVHLIPDTRKVIGGVTVTHPMTQLAHLVVETKGIAEQVVEAALAPYKTAFLYVKVTNLRAINFYERLGFVIVKTLNFKTFSSYIMIRIRH